MKQSLLLYALVIILLLSSCSTVSIPDERLKLRSELLKWETLQGQGIIEINAMGLALRKPFFLAKNQQQLRLDVVDGGVFGAGAAPLLSVYLGDYFALDAPIMPALEALNLGSMIPHDGIKAFASADSLMAHFGDEIIRTKAVVHDSLRINFSNKYLLQSVKDAKSDLELTAGYTNSGNLDNIVVKAGTDMAIKMFFDQVSYTPPEITPLPPKTLGAKDIMELLEGSGLMQIFKGLLD